MPGVEQARIDEAPVVESPDELVPVLLELEDLLRENAAAEAPAQE